MKRHILCFGIFSLILFCCNSEKNIERDFTTIFEKSAGTETATYHETIAYYKKLAASFTSISIDSIGETDSGKPIHYVTYNNDNRIFDFENRDSSKRVVFINNGIHPGEPDGIDATMMLFRDYAKNKIEAPKNTIVVTIPIYNIGGSLNRNSFSRTNQNGPKSYGFRGNGRNFDLNRDFIKADTKNSKTFAQLFSKIQPDVFIDNHVSNGADYQYTLTHLFTQHNKLGGKLGDFLHNEFIPKIENSLTAEGWDITPYVNVFNRTPENGFSQFLDNPRYSTGYTTLFNTLGFMIETHMLKPYKQRVEGTYILMQKAIEITEKKGKEISNLRLQNAKFWQAGMRYPITWKIDSSKHTKLNFKGYKGYKTMSSVTQLKRLKYDTLQPYTKEIPYYNFFKPAKSVAIPTAYIVPKSWHKIISQLKNNNITFEEIDTDTIINVETYRIKSFNTSKSPYEGHYYHFNTEITKALEAQKFSEGDYIIHTNQKGVRFLLETLEPEATDSFFNWNYFDTILQQKEGFSPYVWEDKAEDILNNNKKLKSEFEKLKIEDSTFANNWYAQLDWIHKRSKFYEASHLKYPIYRLLE